MKRGTNDLVVWLPAGRMPAPLPSPAYHSGNRALADGAAAGEADAASDGEGAGETAGSSVGLGDAALGDWPPLPPFPVGDWQPMTATASTATAAAIDFV